MPKNVTIIGAGIVGIATACCLRRDGHDVTVVDMRPPGEYCSFGNAGILSPGSCVPLGMPGTLRKVPKWLSDPQGPLTVRPSYVPKAMPWLLRFIAASRPRRVAQISDALDALLSRTFDAYMPLVQHAGAADLIRRDGYLFVYESEDAYRADALGWKLRREHGNACEELDGDGVREMEPALRAIYPRGVFLPEQGHVANPLRLTQSLAAQFQRDGGRIEQRKVLDIEIGPDGPRALLTDGGRMSVETLVVCAGVHSAPFAATLGSRVPLESQRGYHVTFEQPTVTLQRPVSSGEGKFFVTPMETGLRIAGTVEFAGTEAEPDYRRADALKAHLKRMLPEFSSAGESRWMGHRPCLPDSLPVIGRSPRFVNAYFAFGHGHTGLCGGAPTGSLIADLVTGRTPPIDMAPYRPDRF